MRELGVEMRSGSPMAAMTEARIPSTWGDTGVEWDLANVVRGYRGSGSSSGGGSGGGGELVERIGVGPRYGNDA